MLAASFIVICQKQPMIGFASDTISFLIASTSPQPSLQVLHCTQSVSI